MLPVTAATALEEYLRAVDAAAPGLVQSLYVTGSAASGDFHPHSSDVDAVAVCAAMPSGDRLDALAALHRPGHPSVDVLYATADDLRVDPRTLSLPHSVGGDFRRDGGFQANPVVWRELATTAIPVRGPRLDPDHVWFDRDALRRWTLENLLGYWVERIGDWRRMVPTEQFLRHKDGLPWLVLGVPRLHYTIATLGLTTKTGAGLYALGVVDSRWHPVVRSAVEVRADPRAPLEASCEDLRRQAVEMCEWLVEDARSRTG